MFASNNRLVFDVDFNYSLDKLKDELFHLIDVNKTKVEFNICGPAGGNTCVTVTTDDSTDRAAVEAWLKLHDL